MPVTVRDTRPEASGVIWAVGLSGSGKSTLINAIRLLLQIRYQNIVTLDGDIFRALLRNTTDYTVENRIEQFKKLQSCVSEFEQQNLIVLASCTYCNQELLQTNRKLLRNYYEIYAEASISDLIKEDEKSLYSDYLNGKIKNVVGMDIDWIPPKNPDIVISRFAGKPTSLATTAINNIPFLNH
jgi:adenylylsulfate kinase